MRRAMNPVLSFQMLEWGTSPLRDGLFVLSNRRTPDDNLIVHELLILGSCQERSCNFFRVRMSMWTSYPGEWESEWRSPLCVLIPGECLETRIHISPSLPAVVVPVQRIHRFQCSLPMGWEEDVRHYTPFRIVSLRIPLEMVLRQYPASAFTQIAPGRQGIYRDTTGFETRWLLQRSAP